MNTQEILIQPQRGLRGYWSDLWQYRELFLFLAWRDLSVRYKQTAIGVAWGLIRPLLTVLIFTFVFQRLAKLPSGGVPYPILVYAGILPWQFFAAAMSETSLSLINNAPLVSKVFFPRLLIPASSMVVSIVDFFLSLGVLGLFMAYYRYVPSANILALPFFLALALAAALGAGLWFSALMVKFRDFRFIVPFLLQLGIYVSPVGYLSSIVPEKWRFLYSLNPMVGVIDGFRWALLGGANEIYLPGLLLSTAGVLATLLSGFYYFRKTEVYFADII